jgi:predicted aspartyl protease
VHFARLPLLLASLICLAVGSTFGATEIPFAYRDGMIWLDVTAAGSANSRTTLHFLLDTGAGESVLDLRAAQRLGIKPSGRETVQGVQGTCIAARVNDLAATVSGGLPVPNSMLALDLSAVSAASGAHIDGLLGADFFQGRIVQIDFAAQTIRLLSPSEVPASAGAVPIARRNGAFCIRVAVNGNAPKWMRVDTGYNGALEWVASGAASARANRPSIAFSTGSTNSIHTDVRIGGEHFPGVETGVHQQAMFPGEAGLIGNRLLSHFRVTIDAKAARLLLSRPE